VKKSASPNVWMSVFAACRSSMKIAIVPTTSITAVAANTSASRA
jgi:hypothetical protein